MLPGDVGQFTGGRFSQRRMGTPRLIEPVAVTAYGQGELAVAADADARGRPRPRD